MLEVVLHRGVERHDDHQEDKDHNDEANPPVLREEGHLHMVGATNVRRRFWRLDIRLGDERRAAKSRQERRCNGERGEEPFWLPGCPVSATSFHDSYGRRRQTAGGDEARGSRRGSKREALDKSLEHLHRPPAPLMERLGGGGRNGEAGVRESEREKHAREETTHAQTHAKREDDDG